MPEKTKWTNLLAQRDEEFQNNPSELRKSIAATKRLLGESEEMLPRHRNELAEDDAAE